MIRNPLPLTVLALLLAGCAPAPEPVAAPTVAPPGPPPPVAPALDTETVIARYTCPGAGDVDIIRDGRFARLRMTDGRVVHLGEIRGSRPATWSEVGLRLMVDDDVIELSEAEGRVVACKPTPASDEAARAD